MTPIHVFIGYDPRQPVAFQVLAQSIWERTSCPVSITRLNLAHLPITRRGLTEFTYSRFLVPYLSGYEGISLFLDSDMLCRGDLVDVLAYPLAYPDTSVFVVKNPRKFEWSSFMVFNNARCKVLTPEYIQDPAHKLLSFDWTQTVGELPAQWNHLVGYDAPNPDAKLIHFTQGIPCWPETQGSEFAAEWANTFRRTCSSVSFQELMGQSVHVPYVQQRLQEQANATV